MALLTCRNLSLGYEGHAVHSNLDFQVDPGDYLCILGENGSGKTTLVRTILGLQKPLEGSIDFDSGLKREGIGYLPQQTAIQRDFPATVWEIVLSGCQGRAGLKPFYGRRERALARQNLERMNMSAFRKRCYRELSGGQQQRVLLARALCATGTLLLLDEPVAGLDPVATAAMYALIDGLHREGVTIIMVSHDTAAAARYATRILHMGDEVFFGTVEDYRQSPLGRRFMDVGGGAEA